jgi:hypothetical protein
MKKIKIYFQNWNKDSNEGYVWVCFYIRREKVKFSTKVKCLEKDFDKKYFRIKPSDKLLYASGTNLRLRARRMASVPDIVF